MANKIDLNLDVWKLIRLVFWTGLIVLILGFLAGCGEVSSGGVVAGQPNYNEWLKPSKPVGEGVKGVILPHHLLVKSYMEKFYQQLAAENSYERIVIISPNHFNYGFNFIQTTDWVNTEEKTIDYESRQMLKNAPALEGVWITVLEAAKVLKIEPKYFSREHGVFTHYGFIKKYFPEAKILPIIIKRGTSEKALVALGEEINALINAEEERTLVLASLDFSHYTAEGWAGKNDMRMVGWLAGIGISGGSVGNLDLKGAQEVGVSLDTENKDSVAIDSPEGLYLMAWLMNKQGNGWNLWARTSSASLIEGISAADNTSHIFGWFGK